MNRRDLLTSLFAAPAAAMLGAISPKERPSVGTVRRKLFEALFNEQVRAAHQTHAWAKTSKQHQAADRVIYKITVLRGRALTMKWPADTEKVVLVTKDGWIDDFFLLPRRR